MKKLCTIYFLVLISSGLIAREYKLHWGNVPEADLVMTVYSADPEAEAVLLGETGQLYFRSGEDNYDYELIVHKRIKLLDHKAFEQQGKISIPFYHHQDTEQLISIEAQTIHSDGKVVPLKRRDFYYEQTDQQWTQVKFTFPQLQQGAVIEYRYTLRSKNVVQPRTWYFQQDIPVRFSQLQLYNLTDLSFVTLFEGAEYMETVEKNEDELRLSAGEMRFLSSDQFYLIENAPAIQEETHINNADDYRIRLRLQMSERTNKHGLPNPYIPTWEQAAFELIESPYFGKRYLAKSAYRKLNRTLREHIVLEGSTEQRLHQIYYYLVRQIHWNGLFGIQPERDLYEAFQTGKASAAELNFMLLALLHAQGIEAYAVLTSTRQHGRMIPEYPVLDQFNYVMVFVSIGGRTWLLDATNPLRPPGMPGLHALNKKGWVVNPEWANWINLEVPPCRDRYLVDMKLDKNGRLYGHLEASYTSYSALLERERHRQDPAGYYWQKRLQTWQPDVRLDSVTFSNVDELEAAFNNRFRFNIREAGQSFDNYLYLPLIIYANFSENPFKQKSRNFPVDFPYPFEEEWLIDLHLPPNFTVVELPDDVDYSLPGQEGKLSFKCRQAGDLIRIHFQFHIYRDLIAPEIYPQLKELFNRYVQQVHAKAVLKRI